MKFEIKNRLTGAVKFTAEIECEEVASTSVKLGLAARLAVKAGAYLARADLARADLAGAYLARANLAGAYLAGAYLARADMARADLARANLAGAYLARADLADAYLARAYLAGAYLAGADLARANLARADLAGAKGLSDDQLRPFRADLWMTLTMLRAEVPALVMALREGRVDGSQYEGACACLVGTLANAGSYTYRDVEHNANNPAERWFAMIRKGDKPGDETAGGFAASKALQWTLEWCALNAVEVPAEVVAAQ